MLFPSAPPCTFIKHPGNALKESAASQEQAAPRETRTRPTTVELKLHQIVVSAQKYPACGVHRLDRHWKGPKTSPCRDWCQQQEISRSKGTRDSSFSSKAEHRSVKEQSSHAWDLKHFTAPQHGERQEQVLTFVANKCLWENWRVAKFTPQVYSLTIDWD